MSTPDKYQVTGMLKKIDVGNFLRLVLFRGCNFTSPIPVISGWIGKKHGSCCLNRKTYFEN